MILAATSTIPVGANNISKWSSAFSQEERCQAINAVKDILIKALGRSAQSNELNTADPGEHDYPARAQRETGKHLSEDPKLLPCLNILHLQLRPFYTASPSTACLTDSDPGFNRDTSKQTGSEV